MKANAACEMVVNTFPLLNAFDASLPSTGRHLGRLKRRQRQIIALVRLATNACGDQRFAGGGEACGFLVQGGCGRVIRVLSKEGGSIRPRRRDVVAMTFAQKEENNASELRADYRGQRKHSERCACSLVARPND